MNNSMQDLSQQGFALFQAPVKKGCDGKVTLKGSQAVLNGQTLTGSAVKEGRIEWFPSDKLRFKAASYKAMDRLIQSYGVAWGAGTLVPLPKLTMLLAEFETLRVKFMQEVDLLQGTYDLLIEAHKANQPPAVATVIDQVRLPWMEFRNSFKIMVPTPSVFQPLTSDLQGCADQIVDAVMDEISRDANDIYNKVIGKSQVDPKSLGPIKRLVEKCRDFSILHPAFGSFVDQFETLAASLKPPIAGPVQTQLYGFLGVLADPDAVNHWMANNQQEIELEDGLLQSIFAQQPAVAPQAPVVPVFTPAAATATPAAIPQEAPTQELDWESFGL